MKSKGAIKKRTIAGIIAVLVIWLFAFPIMMVPINIQSSEFWVTMIISLIVFMLIAGLGSFAVEGNKLKMTGLNKKMGIVLGVVIAVFVVANILGSSLFRAKDYASILSVQDAEFSEDLSESVGTDSIALMDTASAKKLGDREIGSLSNVVSQFNVSNDYTQIDYQGKPKKVAALDYAGFFKWINNKSNGVPGYVTVDPVTMSADYQELETGMKYVPSAYIFDNASRHIYLSYPTTMFGNVHFEIDEEGNPYYVASVYTKKISLFGGRTISGCIIMDPVTGEMEKYDLETTPKWVDVVYDGNTICEQYNWYGYYNNGFMNSVIGKKGCKQVTRYVATEQDDDAPISDYGYVAKDGDIWIYTGVTSVNNDSSNIGFLLANERTGESHYFTISGADEKSAMSAAEGEVQEKGYQASFPSLINVDGNPTYIMVLKDNSGLVKLYAAVNVEQYNLVTTASTQSECLAKYRKLLGLEEVAEEVEAAAEEEEIVATDTVTLTISDIYFIDVDGNTYMYLVSDKDDIYKALVKTHEDMLLVKSGATVEIAVNGNEIISCKVIESAKEAGAEDTVEDVDSSEESEDSGENAEQGSSL